MIESLAEIYRCVAWLTKFTDASPGYRKIMVKQNPRYARYSPSQIKSHVLSRCAYHQDESSGKFTFRDEDIWHNYFMKEPMLAERIAELGIGSMSELKAVVLDAHLDQLIAKRHELDEYMLPADDAM